MPLSIKDLAVETRELSITFGDSILKVTYRPWYHTLALEESLRDVPGLAAYNAAAFCKMVSAWDLTDEKGKIIPLTTEALTTHEVPSRVISAIIDAVVEDIRPKEKRQNGSLRS